MIGNPVEFHISSNAIELFCREWGSNLERLTDYTITIINHALSDLLVLIQDDDLPADYDKWLDSFMAGQDFGPFEAILPQNNNEITSEYDMDIHEGIVSILEGFENPGKDIALLSIAFMEQYVMRESN